MGEKHLSDLPINNFFIINGDLSETIYYNLDQDELNTKLPSSNIVLSVKQKELITLRKNIIVTPIEVEIFQKHSIDEVYIKPAKIALNQSTKNYFSSELRLINTYIETAIRNNQTYVKIKQNFSDEVIDYLREQGYEVDIIYSFFQLKHITTITWDKSVEI